MAQRTFRITTGMDGHTFLIRCDMRTRNFLLKVILNILDYLDKTYSLRDVLNSLPLSRASTTHLLGSNLWDRAGLSSLSVTELMELLVTLRITLSTLTASKTSSSVLIGTSPK